MHAGSAGSQSRLDVTVPGALDFTQSVTSLGDAESPPRSLCSSHPKAPRRDIQNQGAGHVHHLHNGTNSGFASWLAPRAVESALPTNPQNLEDQMTIHSTAQPTIAGPTVVPELPLYRVNLMRVGYAVVGFGLVVVKWPLLVTHPEPWPLFEGVVTCILVAMSLLALLGLRYPVRLLPILLFECAWKLIWLAVVVAPKLAAGTLDPATRKVLVSFLVVVIVFAVVPWRHVWEQYVMAKGERWR
jgi:hypothetical protein